MRRTAWARIEGDWLDVEPPKPEPWTIRDEPPRDLPADWLAKFKEVMAEIPAGFTAEQWEQMRWGFQSAWDRFTGRAQEHLAEVPSEGRWESVARQFLGPRSIADSIMAPSDAVARQVVVARQPEDRLGLRPCARCNRPCSTRVCHDCLARW
jgi:hypothetical protein